MFTMSNLSMQWGDPTLFPSVCDYTYMVDVFFCIVGRERVAARGAGGHGEKAGGRPLQAGRDRGGEEPLELYGGGRRHEWLN